MNHALSQAQDQQSDPFPFNAANGSSTISVQQQTAVSNTIGSGNSNIVQDGTQQSQHQAQLPIDQDQPDDVTNATEIAPSQQKALGVPMTVGQVQQLAAPPTRKTRKRGIHQLDSSEADGGQRPAKKPKSDLLVVKTDHLRDRG